MRSIARKAYGMSNDDSPVTSARSKVKSMEKDAEETPKAGGRWPRSTGKAGTKDEGMRLAASAMKDPR